MVSTSGFSVWRNL